MQTRQKQKLGKKKSEILQVIQEFHDQFGYTPTIREIGERTGMTSTSHVSYHLKQLCELGYIQRDPNISRGIRILNPLSPTKEITPLPATRCIPILGRIQAGQPIPIPTSDFPHFDPESVLDLPESMLGKMLGNLYALQVKGDSMRDMLIHEGDIVILREAKQAQNGQIVAAWLKRNGETTLKSYFLENDGRVRLQPANPDFQPIYAKPDEVEIQGHVVMLFRSYLAGQAF